MVDNVFAFTGHRPPKLGGFDDSVRLRLVAFAKRWLSIYPPDTIVSGMALGWDTAVAQAALQSGIPLIAAVPFEGQERLWPPAHTHRYHEFLRKASDVVVVSEGGFANWKMQKRNEWMVDRCTLLVSLFDGSSGGTANCIEYATRIGKPVTNLWSEWRSFGENAATGPAT